MAHDMKRVHLISGCLLFLFIGIGSGEKNETGPDASPFCRCSRTKEEDGEEIECRCTGNDLLHIPRDLPANLARLTVEDAAVTILRSNSLKAYNASLRDLSLMNLEEFYYFEPGIFYNMDNLQTIYIQRAPKLIKIPSEVFDVHLPRLKILRITNTALEEMPTLNQLRTNSVLHMIDLENNRIQLIASHQVQVQTEHLLLNYNDIREVQKEAFKDSQIGKLSLRGNSRLKTIHEKAFSGLLSLRYIDLSETAITVLPVEGLAEIDVLKVQDTWSLKVFPSIYNFKYIQEAWLTYPYHCCAFRFPDTHNPGEYAKHELLMRSLRESCARNGPGASVGRSLLQWLPLTNDSFDEEESEKIWADEEETFHPDGVSVNKNHPVTVVCGNLSKNYHEVRCFPQPDAFNPCEDLMGNWALRIPVWLISLSAIIGNLLVVIVISSSRFRLTVPKFLMCNLAIADLCIGLHLFLIAVVDACSIGTYFNYAIYWQRGDGCKIAGFLTVFGNVLSVYTLTVITTERWYTITWAIHLNKRLKLRTAARVMTAGWCCALLMATLPLVGISGYTRTSICLPLEQRGKADTIYLSTLLAFNAFAFGLICVCYTSMYRSIKEGNTCSTTSVRSDLTVAKRMSLLVFTDFACWAPIAFFGLTALLGRPLITVTQTKILLVFFYPLNSCANPCLYALLTQQYRRDLFVLLGRCGLCKDRAERHKGAIGGVPLPYNSGPRHRTAANPLILKPASEEANDATHRGSLLTNTTFLSADYQMHCRYGSRYACKPDSLCAIQEMTPRSLVNRTRYDPVENGRSSSNRYMTSGHL